YSRHVRWTNLRRLLSGGAKSVQRNYFYRRPAVAQYGAASAVGSATRFRETAGQLPRIVLRFCVAVTGAGCAAYDLGAAPCRTAIWREVGRKWLGPPGHRNPGLGLRIVRPL